MTATGYIGTNVDLNLFYDNVPVIDINDVSMEGIVYAEFGSNKHSQIFKGTNLKKRFVRVNGKKEASTKRFDNSVTIKLRLNEENMLNLKLFKNGKIQMTGVKSREQGKHAIEKIITIIKNIYAKENEIVDDCDSLEELDFNIHLINSDFKVNMEIRRDFLYNLLMDDFQVICTYEPCIYPGVKIQYYLNKDANIEKTDIKKQGVCCCQTPCDGKGDGFTTTSCKKITISIFQSGCILITGVTSEKHIIIAYNFITNILKSNQDRVKRVKLELPIV